jgi:hypothetical protein
VITDALFWRRFFAPANKVSLAPKHNSIGRFSKSKKAVLEIRNWEELRLRIQPRDPVARFHLHNGARLERINWLGDRSDKGLRQSAGIMVNYVYNLKHIEDNHEAYVKDGRVTAARAVRGMLSGDRQSNAG